MDYLRRNSKAIAGALVGVLSVLVPAYVTTGTISPQAWGLAVVALIGGHQLVYASPANKATVETALGVLLPVLSKRSPYAAESLKAAIGAVPEYVPTAVQDAPLVPDGPATGAYPDGPYTPPAPGYTGPVPPASEHAGATAAPAS